MSSLLGGFGICPVGDFCYMYMDMVEMFTEGYALLTQ